MTKPETISKAVKEAWRAVYDNCSHQHRWRNVDDKLPLDNTDVLVKFNIHDDYPFSYDIARYDSKDRCFYLESYSADSLWLIVADVVAWKPIN